MAKTSTTQKTSLLGRIAPFMNFLGGSRDLTVVLFIVAILAIIIVPLPAAMLDFFLALSFALSALIILIALYVNKPTDFSAFPTLLLIITLFRLALNIATTRMILSNGHLGPQAVSEIVTAFGQFVVGGNYVIGIILFVILVIINFMVVTNGSTRVSEVKARFTLDAMPGKQMAIDADLNTGLINQEEAKRRRDELAAEADFYGSMDGANKFVKGDAIAGIIITLINIIGGFLIGVFQRDMTMADAAANFTILTIGDGLVSQLPALIVATATGIIVTRFSKEGENFAAGIIDQLINESKTLVIVGTILLLFAMVPGLPTISLGFVGLLFLLLAYLLNKQQDGSFSAYIESLFNRGKKSAGVKKPQTGGAKLTAAPAGVAAQQGAAGGAPVPAQPKLSPEEQAKKDEEELNNVLRVEVLRIDLGYQLVKFVEPSQGGDIITKIRSMRKNIANDFGIVVPKVHLRDNVNIPPDSYSILLKEVVVATGRVMPDKLLAIPSGGMVGSHPDGIPAKDPVFGLDAYWIDPSKRDEWNMSGYTPIDASSVICTHIQEVIKRHAEDLLTRQEVYNLLEKLGRDYPILAEEIKGVGIGMVQRILKALLHEQIPIKDMLTIAESIADYYPMFKGNPNELTEYVRHSLARVITSAFKSDDGILKYLVLSPNLEQFLIDKLPKKEIGQTYMSLSPDESAHLVSSINEMRTQVAARGVSPVIIGGVSPLLRKAMATFTEQYGQDVIVLSIAEVDPSTSYEILGTIE